jgi:hypothetical protein
VVNRVASLEEIERWWSVVDLLDANEALDLQIAADFERAGGGKC